MGGKNYYVSGSHNVTCDVCSKKIKAHEAKTRWDGFIVCGDCFENRHPQDFVKTKQDKITVPYIRPPTDTFIAVPYIIYIDDGYIKDGYFFSHF